MLELLDSFQPDSEVLQQRKLILTIGATFGPYYLNLFATRKRLLGDYSVDATTNVFTLTAHGLSNGDLVQVAPVNANLSLTDGLDTGRVYAIISATTDTFELSTTIGGSAVDVFSEDVGLLYACGTPYDLTSHTVWAWVKHLASDPDSPLVLDLDPQLDDPVGVGYNWRIVITFTPTDTFLLDPGSHLWDLLIEFPDSSRRFIVEDGFVIKQPVTHPALV